MKSSQVTERSGVVVFLTTNRGSKSESLQPYLYQSRDIPLLRIMYRGDNPFENDRLLEYDGKRIDVCGVLSESGTLIVERIRKPDSETMKD